MENILEQKNKGHHHPISIVIEDVSRIFSELGFEVAQGPEIETEYNNFDALNVPKDHPARDMQDTFWLKEKDKNGESLILRSQTSPVQIRYMNSHKPPIRIISPGKVFRNEATDASHEAQFHQVEGLMIDKDISMANLKWVLDNFFDKLFGKNLEIRFRPSFFPFVEPGVEIDISCFKCDGKGCGLCKGTGWIEVMGAGMVHPKVLENGGINPREYQGFAFGGGIDRIAMLKYGIEDIRLLYSGDLRLVNQF
ncbi:MAG: phenylalanine--tRNA ligase subunit alpha [Candidatus Paceibacterota bacterium]